MPTTPICQPTAGRVRSRRPSSGVLTGRLSLASRNESGPITCCRAVDNLQQLEHALKEAKAEEEAATSRRQALEAQFQKAVQTGLEEAKIAASALQGPGAGVAVPGVRVAPKRIKKKSRRMAAYTAAAGMALTEHSFQQGKSQQPSQTEPGLHNGVQRLQDGLSDFADQYWLQPWTPQDPLENDPPSDDAASSARPIFIISDCTGESAARTVRAALGQFEGLCKRRCPAHLVVFRFLSDQQLACKIIERAAEENALVVFTLADPNVVRAVMTAAKLCQVTAVDLWSTLLDNMENHLHSIRSGLPLGDPNRRPVLTEDYFKRIEAVEFTRKMDDGAMPQHWAEADLLVLGVSRCGKTPLSIYMGQRGYKVANLPLVPGVAVPRELYEIDQSRIVGLIIDPNMLANIRKNRVTQMGVGQNEISYSEIRKVQSELEHARTLYQQHPEWPILDVTFRGVEETAVRILRIMAERRRHVTPMWSEKYQPASVC